MHMVLGTASTCKCDQELACVHLRAQTHPYTLMAHNAHTHILAHTRTRAHHTTLPPDTHTRTCMHTKVHTLQNRNAPTSTNLIHVRQQAHARARGGGTTEAIANSRLTKGTSRNSLIFMRLCCISCPVDARSRPLRTNTARHEFQPRRHGPAPQVESKRF